MQVEALTNDMLRNLNHTVYNFIPQPQPMHNTRPQTQPPVILPQQKTSVYREEAPKAIDNSELKSKHQKAQEQHNQRILEKRKARGEFTQKP